MADKSESKPVTLEMLEEHLKKQDQVANDTAWNTGWVVLIAFAGSICVAGITLIATQITTWGWSLVIYGVVLLFVFWVISAISKKRRK